MNTQLIWGEMLPPQKNNFPRIWKGSSNLWVGIPPILLPAKHPCSRHCLGKGSLWGISLFTPSTRRTTFHITCLPFFAFLPSPLTSSSTMSPPGSSLIGTDPSLHSPTSYIKGKVSFINWAVPVEVMLVKYLGSLYWFSRGVCIREVSVLERSVLERCLYQRDVCIREVSVLERCLY